MPPGLNTARRLARLFMYSGYILKRTISCILDTCQYILEKIVARTGFWHAAKADCEERDLCNLMNISNLFDVRHCQTFTILSRWELVALARMRAVDLDDEDSVPAYPN